MRKTKVKFASRTRKSRRAAVTNRRQPRRQSTVVHAPMQSEAERRIAMQELDRKIVERLGPSALLCWED